MPSSRALWQIFAGAFAQRCLTKRSLERLPDKSGKSPSIERREPAKTGRRSPIWPSWTTETQDLDALRLFFRRSQKLDFSHLAV
jgi:hypothetical protein